MELRALLVQASEKLRQEAWWELKELLVKSCSPATRRASRSRAVATVAPGVLHRPSEVSWLPLHFCLPKPGHVSLGPVSAGSMLGREFRRTQNPPCPMGDRPRCAAAERSLAPFLFPVPPHPSASHPHRSLLSTEGVPGTILGPGGSFVGQNGLGVYSQDSSRLTGETH